MHTIRVWFTISMHPSPSLSEKFPPFFNGSGAAWKVENYDLSNILLFPSNKD